MPGKDVWKRFLSQEGLHLSPNTCEPTLNPPHTDTLTCIQLHTHIYTLSHTKHSYSLTHTCTHIFTHSQTYSQTHTYHHQQQCVLSLQVYKMCSCLPEKLVCSTYGKVILAEIDQLSHLLCTHLHAY